MRWAIFLCLFLTNCFLFREVEKAPQTADVSKPQGNLEAFWIGHATVLVRMHDKWVITDPVFVDSIALVIKRYVAPGIEAAKLPPISWVLASHLHMDHLDWPSLGQLPTSATLAIPPGVVPHMPPLHFKNIQVLKKNQSHTADGIKVTAVPVIHFGGRVGFDLAWSNNSYTGYMIEYAGITVFFAGDTGYKEGWFPELAKKYKIDLALIPVGPYRGIKLFEDLKRRIHVNPFEAMTVFEETGARYMVPIHHSTFYLRGDPEIGYIREAIQKSGRMSDVFLLDIGQNVAIDTKAGKVLRINAKS